MNARCTTRGTWIGGGGACANGRHVLRCARSAAIIVRAMTESCDESLLATLLCTQILTASQIRTLCQSRGFPLTGGAKDVVARAVAGRLLKPAGVAQAMTALDPAWLRVLRVVAAADEPVSLRTVARALGRLGGRYVHLDYRALWSEVVTGLASRGVVLVLDAAAAKWETSRYARYHIVLPRSFAHLLPPMTLETEPVAGNGCQGDLDDLLAGAIEVLTAGDRPRAAAATLVACVAARLSLKDGLLRVVDLETPDGPRLARFARDLWTANLGVKGQEVSEVRPGPLAVQILGSLASGAGCSAEALATVLDEVGYGVKTSTLEAFLEDGVVAGFLVRFDRAGAAPLFRVAAAPPVVAARDALRLEQTAAGTRIVPEGTGLLPLLQAATVAHVALADGAFVLEPDPVRLGRSWHALPESVRNALTAGSRAFRDAAEQVERRAGQVVVHRGLAVLRVEDAGLHALLVQRLGECVRALDARHLACLVGRLAEVLALTRKEGYVARRLT